MSEYVSITITSRPGPTHYLTTRSAIPITTPMCSALACLVLWLSALQCLSRRRQRAYIISPQRLKLIPIDIWKRRRRWWRQKYIFCSCSNRHESCLSPAIQRYTYIFTNKQQKPTENVKIFSQLDFHSACSFSVG